MESSEGKKSFGELAETLTEQSAILLRQEIKLVRLQMLQFVSERLREVLYFVGGFIFLLLSLLLLIGAVLAVLHKQMPFWQAALLVSTFLGILGGWLTHQAMKPNKNTLSIFKRSQP